MSGLLCSALNFLFLYWAGVVPFVPIYNITALIKMVGGWVGGLVWVGVWVWAWGLLGWAELSIKDSSVSFCTFADARSGLQCDGWMDGR